MIIDALYFSNWTREFCELVRRSEISAVHVTVSFHEQAREAMTNIAEWNKFFLDNGDIAQKVHTGADIRDAEKNGRVGIILGAQNCSHIESELGMVEVFHDAGLRVMQLSYNHQTLCGAGWREDADPGLSVFGKLVVREMNRVGMVVDISHSGERTSLDAIEYSDRPVAATHANPRGFRDTLRNKSTDLIKALAESGGMLGFSLYPPHLKNDDKCSLEEFCQMVADTAELVGADNLGIGSDTCLNWDGKAREWLRDGRWRWRSEQERDELRAAGWPEPTAWYREPADIHNVKRGLQSVGFSSAEVDKIMGLNWLSFFTDGFSPSGQ